ncbi:hypothetical protein MESS4_130013 [Mesorhizobium sp. STM 4661]|nr:hypothetical protein MESS4_130013 [Mesorhizobium sp. STM 4661]
MASVIDRCAFDQNEPLYVVEFRMRGDERGLRPTGFDLFKKSIRAATSWTTIVRAEFIPPADGASLPS